MPNDPIIDEVRKIRDEYARKFGYDLDRIFADLKKSEVKRRAAASRARGAKSVRSAGQPAKITPARRGKAA